MFRLATATLLCVTLCIMVQIAPAQPSKIRDLGLLDLESEDTLEDETILETEQQQRNSGNFNSMFRLAKATLLCVALCIMVQIAPAQPTNMRDLGLLGLESEETLEDETIQEAEQQRTDLGNLSSVVGLIKNQFKEIIQELGLQVLQYSLYVFQQLKVKFMSKLGLYTVSDIFEAIFHGVTNLFADSPSELVYFHEQVNTTPEPITDFLNSYWPLFRRS